MSQSAKYTRWVVVIIGILAAVSIGVYTYHHRTESSQTINDFDSCKENGGEVSNDTCRYDDKEYSSQAEADSGGGYVGLDEKAALERAERKGKPARVVKRDDENLAITMDLRDGRLNFTVNDGVVTAVDVERVNLK